MKLNARVEVVPSSKLFATMLLHIPYCEKLIFGQRPTPKSKPKWQKLASLAQEICTL